MLRLIRLILFGHIHNWQVISVVNIRDGDGNYCGQNVAMRCSECGEVKFKKRHF